MRRSLDLYLSDMWDASKDILKFTAGTDFAQFEADRKLSAAVLHWFTVLGEAMHQLQRHYPEYMHGILESRRIVDFRNFLVHQYASVDSEEVWSIIQSKLPQFHRQIGELIEERLRADSVGKA